MQNATGGETCLPCGEGTASGSKAGAAGCRECDPGFYAPEPAPMTAGSVVTSLMVTSNGNSNSTSLLVLNGTATTGISNINSIGNIVCSPCALGQV